METECPDSPDGIHCRDWYEGDECCFCGAPAMPEEDKEQ